MSGAHKCPRRGESHFGSTTEATPDRWRDDEACSYCGSLEPGLLMRRLEAGDIELGPTDKSYKAYVKPFGEGAPALRAIKLYFQHLSHDQMHRFIEALQRRQAARGIPGALLRAAVFPARRHTQR